MLVSLCVAEAVLFVNTTAFNLALPSVARSFNASTAEQQWVVSVYPLCFVAVLLIAGFFGDLIGYRHVLLTGLTSYAAASVLGVVAANMVMLIAARALLGVAAGMFIPMGLALITTSFSANNRSRAVTIWTVAGTLGIPLGPIIGGGMTLVMGWKGLFIFDVIAMAVALVLNWTFLPKDRAEGRAKTKFPLLQSLLMIAGVSLLSTGLINAQKALLSWATLLPFLSGLTLAWLFVFVVGRSDTQLTDLSLMRFTSFKVSSVALLLLNFAAFGVTFILPTYLEAVKGQNALTSGLMLMPMVAAAIAGAMLNKSFVNKIGERRACLMGLFFIGFGLLTIALGIYTGVYGILVVGQIVAGIGMGSGQPVSFSWAFCDVPSERSGKGSSLLSVFQQLGSILGIGVFGSIQGALYVRGLSSEVQGTGMAVANTVTASLQQATNMTGQAAAALRQSAIRAYVSAGTANFIISGLIVMIALMVVFLMSRKPMGKVS